MAMLKNGIAGLERMLLLIVGGSEEEFDPDIAEGDCGQVLMPSIITLQVQPKAIPAAASAALGGIIAYSNPTSKGVKSLLVWDFSFLNHFKSTIL